MSLIQLVGALVAAGVVLWLVYRYFPMDARIKSILNVVIVIVVVLWLLSVFGVVSPISGFRVVR